MTAALTLELGALRVEWKVAARFEKHVANCLALVKTRRHQNLGAPYDSETYLVTQDARDNLSVLFEERDAEREQIQMAP